MRCRRYQWGRPLRCDKKAHWFAEMSLIVPSLCARLRTQLFNHRYNNSYQHGSRRHPLDYRHVRSSVL